MRHRHVRFIKRVALKHHSMFTVFASRSLTTRSPIRNLDTGDLSEPGEHAQRRVLRIRTGRTSTSARLR